MDRFCLALPRDNDNLRQETLDGFFRWLGRDYERFIDVPRNLENIAVLVGLLGLVPPAVIGDFGCGSGLAHATVSAVGYAVIGVDTCPVMRELARTRGMRTFSPSEFAATDLPVDGMISSYVLHFRPERLSLSLCWSRLRRGGRFAANIHKAQGLDRALAQFAQLNGRVLSVGSRAGMERHGIYLQIEKP
jgi:SAM-dependent methyltransferase